MDRTVNLDTQATGQAIFFGYVGNRVILNREGNDGRRHTYQFGTTQREMGPTGQTSHGDLSGNHTYQPSWLLMQSPMVTRVYACQPHGGGYFRMAGGQGAEWSTDRRPLISDVQFYRGSRVRFEATGYGVVWSNRNWNYITVIDVDERWPCEILKDFSLPAGAMAVSDSREDRGVNIEWSSDWGCR